LAPEEYEEKEKEMQTIHGKSLGNKRVKDFVEKARKNVLENYRIAEQDKKRKRDNPDASDGENHS